MMIPWWFSNKWRWSHGNLTSWTNQTGGLMMIQPTKMLIFHGDSHGKIHQGFDGFSCWERRRVTISAKSWFHLEGNSHSPDVLGNMVPNQHLHHVPISSPNPDCQVSPISRPTQISDSGLYSPWNWNPINTISYLYYIFRPTNVDIDFDSNCSFLSN